MGDKVGMLKKIYILPLFISLTAYPSEILAQDNSSSIPETISVSMILAPEREACKPSGYRRGGGCEFLSYNEIELFRKKNYPESRYQGIPPGILLLRDKIFRPLSTYVKHVDKKNSHNRKAMVIVIDFGRRLKNVPIEIGSTTEKVPYKRVVKNSSVYIYHENAVRFLPSKRIDWTIKLGNGKNCKDNGTNCKEWTFKVNKE